MTAMLLNATHKLNQIICKTKAMCKFSVLVFSAVMLSGAGPAYAAEEASSIARGGRLYDTWWAVAGTAKPDTAHPGYPAEGQYKGKGGADWRCKECHGWDYLGKDGAYGQGSHATGIVGIRAAEGKDPGVIIEILKRPVHGFNMSMLSEQDFQDLALFVSKGQVDMDQYIDRASKTPKNADAGNGEPVFNTVCAKCHGKDGLHDEEGDLIGDDLEPLGHVAKSNPWETLHKIRHGQPDENMPSLLVFDVQIALDLLAYMQTLPEEVPK
jgi:thiosulfate dehydrogenase